MKKIVLLGIMLCMLVGNIGCVNSAKEEAIQSINNEQAVIQKEIKVITLNKSDLTFSDGVDTIVLDTLYEDFETREAENKAENSVDNYVGEVSVGEHIYRTYTHQYEDFIIYTSNMNYPYKCDDINTYYITQIDLINDKYMTARGIHIGCNLKEIFEIYGKEDLITNNDSNDENIELTYQYDNYVLEFILSNKENLERISLYVLPME